VRSILVGAEKVGIAGVFVWLAFVLEPSWVGQVEREFGVVRLDGSLKPSALTLASFYRRWRLSQQAPWDT
jgi:hypothetical protein